MLAAINSFPYMVRASSGAHLARFCMYTWWSKRTLICVCTHTHTYLCMHIYITHAHAHTHKRTQIHILAYRHALTSPLAQHTHCEYVTSKGRHQKCTWFENIFSFFSSIFVLLLTYFYLLKQKSWKSVTASAVPSVGASAGVYVSLLLLTKPLKTRG